MALLLLCSASAVAAQWRPISAEEEQFVQAVEKRAHKILSDAARKMPGRWETKIETDSFQRHELDEGQHAGRPHEVRVRLVMDYQPTDAEGAQLEKEIFAHAEQAAKHDPISDELNRVNPEFQTNIFVSFVVNYYGFMPVALADIPSLGYETQVPGAVLSYVRWKNMGVQAPQSFVYLGQYKREPASKATKIVEDFSAVTNCRDAKTILLQVNSNEKNIEKFVSHLDLSTVKALLNEL